MNKKETDGYTRASNYEIMKHRMEKEFLKYDQEKMIQKFGLLWDADYNEAMTLYDILCYSKEGCCPSGEYISIQGLSSLKGSAPSYAGRGFFQKEESLFDHKDAQLSKACEMLRGFKTGKGDVSFLIPVFGSLSVLFQFWNSDEEFPASLQILCDKNILDYMHYETVWFMASHLVRRLKEEMSVR